MQLLNLTMFIMLFTAALLRAQEQVPQEVADVTVVERLGQQLPLDATLMDEKGNNVTLGDCIKPGKPAVLQLGYFGCPMLCDTVSQGLLKSMKELDLNIGQDFSVIYVSFDPKETFGDAGRKKLSYLKQYDRPGAEQGWHFRVAPKASIRAITEATGFQYKWVESSKQFAHAAVLMVITPDGRISRYLYGVEFPKRTLQLSLVEASQGSIGSTTDRLLMMCYRYDSKTGHYTFFATNLMRGGAAVTVVVLGAWIGRMLLKERRARLSTT
jgi:protein SCO1/2